MNQIERHLPPACLKRKDTQQVQRVRVRGVTIQRLSIRRLRAGKIPMAVTFESGFERFLNCGLHHQQFYRSSEV